MSLMRSNGGFILKPFTLYGKCKFYVIRMVLESCIKIQAQYGSYDDKDSQESAASVQEYLSSGLPAHLLDDLCDGLKMPIQTKLNQWDDRTVLAVYMHPFMRKLSVDFRLPCDDSFWLTKLPKLGRIRTLDLKMVCTDEILEVVGTYCPLLEKVNITSKAESNDTVSGKDFNALKLKFFVSDDGLRHLCQCKQLRKICMNKLLRSQFGGRMMTDAGIRELLIALPKLQYISYSDVGSVLESGMEKLGRLALTNINDFHPHPNHIVTFSKLCPDLQHLCMSIPTGGTENHEELGNAILKQLVKCELNLSALELTHFPVKTLFGEYLPGKGEYLTSFSTRNIQPITSKEILVIGQQCPNIVTLHLNELISDEGDEAKWRSAQRLQLFTELRCLSLTGREWDAEIILPLCLSRAKVLSNFHLLNAGCTQFMDKAIQTVLLTNPLSELETGLLFSGCLISYNSLQAIIKSCTKLRRLGIWQNPHLMINEVRVLVEQQRNRNVDIDVIVMPF